MEPDQGQPVEQPEAPERQPFEVLIEKEAAKYLRKMPERLRNLMQEAIDELADDPYVGDVKSIRDNLYRKRKGGYRILYTLDAENRVVHVKNIGPRGDIYK